MSADGQLDREAAGTAAAPAPPAAGLSEEQRARIEQNRQLARQRKQQQQHQQHQQCSPSEGERDTVAVAAAPSAPQADGISAEQLARIEQNRVLAVERKRKRAEAEQGQATEESQPAAAAGPQPAEESCPSPTLDSPSSSSSEEDEDSDESSSDSDGSSSEAMSDDECSELDGAASPSASAQSSDEEGAGAAGAPPAAVADAGLAAERSAVSKQLTGAQQERIKQNQLLAHKRQRLRGLGAKTKGGGAVAKPTDAISVPDKAAGKEVNILPKRERTAKQKLVAELLCRWWYALPPWPPEDFDAMKVLEERRCRVVPVEEFEFEPEFDDQGRKKVFAVSGFPGVFRDEQGELLDVRPEEGRPSYDQMIKRPQAELHRLLLLAYDRQLKELEAQPLTGPVAEEHRRQLKRKMAATRGNMFTRLLQPAQAAPAQQEPAPTATAAADAEVQAMTERLKGIATVARSHGRDPAEMVEAFGRRIAEAGHPTDAFRAAADAVLARHA